MPDAPVAATHFCTLCDLAFTAEDPDSPRCPECLKKSGVIDAGSGPTGPARVPRNKAPWLVVGALLLAAGGGIWWYLQRAPDDGPIPEDPVAAARAVLNQGALPDDIAICFEVTDAVRGFAGGLAGSFTGTRVEPFVEALANASRDGRYGLEPRGDVDLPGAPRTADAIARAIAASEAPTLTGYELACLAIASATANGLEFQIGVSKTAANSGTAVRRKSFGLLADGRFFDLGAGVADNVTVAQALTPSEFVAFGEAMRAAWHLQQGENADAAQAIANAQELMPSEPALVALSGQIKVATGMPDFGIQDIAKAVNAQPDALGYYNLGMAYALAESPFKAFQSLKKATELDPRFAEGWMGLANLEMQRVALLSEDQAQAKLDEVQGYFDKATEIDPELQGLRVSKAQLLLLRGKTDEAKALLEEAVKAHPDSPDANLMLGQIALEEDAPAAAVEYLEKAALSVAAKARGEQARTLLTMAYASLGDWTRATEFSRKLVAAAPDAEDTRLMLAGALREAGKVEQAVQVLEEQREHFPKDPFAPLLLAQLALDAKQWDRAVQLAQDSQKARASFEGMLVEMLGLFGSGKRDAALALVEAEAKRRANARVQAAQALLEQGEVEPAAAVLQQAIEQEPENAEAAVLLYMADLVLGRESQADAVRTAALDRAPEDQRREWERQFDEGKQQIEAMVRNAPALSEPAPSDPAPDAPDGEAAP